MKLPFSGLILMLFICPLYGQINLVPNPSFEYHNQCPNGGRPGGIWNPVPWTDDPLLSSDYYDSCGVPFFDVPGNFTGYQLAQDSFAFIGMALYVMPSMSSEYREYAQVRLADTLEAGRNYCVSFYVSLADTVNYGISNISAFFSPVSGGTNQATYFTYQAQINNPDSNFVVDKVGWSKISGSFVANGDEIFMILGNFQPDSLTNFTIADTSDVTTGEWQAYYYFDNVSVIATEVPEAGITVQICGGDSVQLGVTGIADITYSWTPGATLSDSTISNPIAKPTSTTTYTLTQTQCDAVLMDTVTIFVMSCDTPSVFFIPTVLAGNQVLEISGLEENSRLTIYDVRGRRVYYSENYQNNFQANSVAEGQYVLELETSQGERIKQKLVITR